METKSSLKKKIAELEHDIKIKDAAIAAYQRQFSEQTTCSSSGFCSACKHGIPVETREPFYNCAGAYYNPFVTTYLCDLDKDCASFERK
ncbi:MAG: hypothetical protein K2N06_05430 [Oscillospiraceae bacterium]|nr:hypothetical protein [Oscillospiraceae bacterium]